MIVFIVDEHKVLASALGDKIRNFPRVNNLEVFHTSKQLLDVMSRLPADVVILDYELTGLDGYDVAKMILKKYRNTKVILVTKRTHPNLIRDCMEIGINALIDKTTEEKELEKAIISVHTKGYYHTELTYKAMRDMIPRLSSYTMPKSLTPREKEVLKLVCEENNVYEMAEKLFLSHKTVSHHRQSLLRKLQVKNTAGLVRKAIQLGYYPVDRIIMDDYS